MPLCEAAMKLYGANSWIVQEVPNVKSSFVWLQDMVTFYKDD
jgi:hypothetical protein